VWQVFEVAPSLYMIEVRKAAGDTLEYHKVGTPHPTSQTTMPCFLFKFLCTIKEFMVGFWLNTDLLFGPMCSFTRVCMHN
jgi:hypothetical protein